MMLSVLCSLSALSAYNVGIDVERRMNPMPPNAGELYQNTGQYFTVHLANLSSEPANVRLEMVIRFFGYGADIVDAWVGNGENSVLDYPYIMVSKNSIDIPSIHLEGNNVKMMSMAEISAHFRAYASNDLTASKEFKELIDNQEGLLQEGHYGLRMQVVNNENNEVLGADECYFDISYNASAPQFITPVSPDLNDPFADEYDIPTFNVRESGVTMTWSQPQYNLSIPGQWNNFTYDVIFYGLSEQMLGLTGGSLVSDVLKNGITLRTEHVIGPMYNLLSSRLREWKTNGFKKVLARVKAKGGSGNTSSRYFVNIDNEGYSKPILLDLSSISGGSDEGGSTPAVDDDEEEGTKAFDLNVELLTDDLPTEIAPYFDNPSKYFRISVANNSGSDRDIAMFMQIYYIDDQTGEEWGVMPMPTAHKPLNKHFSVENGWEYTLSDNELDRFAGGYSMQQICEFLPVEGYYTPQPTEHTHFVDVQNEGVHYMVCFRLVNWQSGVNSFLDMKGLKRTKTPLEMSEDVHAQKRVDVTIEPLSQYQPQRETDYYTEPGRIFKISMQNMQNNPVEVFPLLTYENLPTKTGFGTDPLEDLELLQSLKVTLKAREKRELTMQEVNALLRWYGTVPVTDEILLDEDMPTAAIQLIDATVLTSRQADVLADFSVNGANASFIVGHDEMDIHPSAEANLRAVDVIIEPSETEMPDDGTYYYSSPSRYFTVKLRNNTGSDLRLRPYMAFTYNGIHYGHNPLLNEAELKTVKAGATITLTPEELDGYCGGAIGAPNVYSLKLDMKDALTYYHVAEGAEALSPEQLRDLFAAAASKEVSLKVQALGTGGDDGIIVYGQNTHDFEVSHVYVCNIAATIEPGKTKMVPKGKEVYQILNEAKEYFKITLDNQGAVTENITLALVLGNKYYGYKEAARQTLSLPAGKHELTADEMDRLLGGLTSSDIMQLTKVEDIVNGTHTRDAAPKLPEGENDVCLVLLDPEGKQILTLAKATFFTSFTKLKVGKFVVDVKTLDPAKDEAGCFKGTGTVTVGGALKIKVDFTDIYVKRNEAGENIVYKNSVRSARDGVQTHLDQQTQGDPMAEALRSNLRDMLNKAAAQAGLGDYMQYINKIKSVKANLTDGIQLPYSLSDIMTIDDKGTKGNKSDLFDIQLQSMEFAAEGAWMDLMAEFAMPNTNIAEDMLILGSRHLEIPDPDKGSYLPPSGSLILLSDVTFNDPSSGFAFSFLAPQDKQLDQTLELPHDGCFIAWKDKAFGGLQIDARITLPKAKIEKCNINTLEVVPGVAPDVRLTATIFDAEDWLAQVSMDAFQLKDAPGYAFVPTGEGGIGYDHSVTRNPARFTFPENYTTGDNKVPDTWQGFFFDQLSIQLPPFMLNKASGKPAKATLEKIIYDSEGFTCKAELLNILSLETGKCGGWGISVDELSVSVLKSNFEKFRMAGNVQLPLLQQKDNNGKKSKAKMHYQCDVVNIAHEQGAATQKVNFKAMPENNLCFDFLLAEVQFEGMGEKQDNASTKTYFNLEYETGKDVEMELCLGGQISLGSTDDEVSDKKPTAFSLPGIHFEGMKLANHTLQTKGKDNTVLYSSDDLSFDLGRWSFSSPAKSVGPFTFSLDKYGIKTDSGKRNADVNAGLFVAGSVEVAGNVTTTVGLTVWADLKDLTSSPSIGFGGMTLDEIKIKGAFGESIKLEGGMTVNEGIYSAELGVELPGDLLKFHVAGQYGKAEWKNPEGEVIKYTTAFLEADASSSAMSSLQPVGISRLGGGFYFNCDISKKPKYGMYGGKLGVGLTFGGEAAIKADGDLYVFYDKEARRLSDFVINATVDGVNAPNSDKGLVHAEASIIYRDTHGPDPTLYPRKADDSSADGTEPEQFLSVTATVDASMDLTEKFTELTGIDVDKFIKDMPTTGLPGLSTQSDEYGSTQEYAGTDMGAGDASKATDPAIKDQLEKDKNLAGSLTAKAGAHAALDFKINFIPDQYGTKRWHLYLGEPGDGNNNKEKRCSITLIDFQVGKDDSPLYLAGLLYADAYLCIGNEMPNGGALAPIPEQVVKFLNGEDLNGQQQSGNVEKINNRRADAVREMLSKGNTKFGLMLGSSIMGRFACNAVVPYVDVSCIAGFDISFMLQDGMKCLDGKPAGRNGMYGTGQVYAMLQGKFGLMLNLWIYTGKYELLNVGLGALMQGGFFNPSWLYGNARFQAKLFDGLIKFNSSMQFKVGDVCLPSYGDPLADIKIFNEVLPGDSVRSTGLEASEDRLVSPFIVPSFTTNMKIGAELRLFDKNKAQEMVGMEGDINDALMFCERTYKFTVSPNVYLQTTTGDGTNEAQWVDDRIAEWNTKQYESFSVNTHGPLLPDTKYRMRLSGYAQELYTDDNGVTGWHNPRIRNEETGKNEVKEKTEEYYSYFVTGPLPKDLAQCAAIARPGTKRNEQGVPEADAYFDNQLFREEALSPYLSLMMSRQADLVDGMEDCSIEGVIMKYTEPRTVKVASAKRHTTTQWTTGGGWSEVAREEVIEYTPKGMDDVYIWKPRKPFSYTPEEQTRYSYSIVRIDNRSLDAFIKETEERIEQEAATIYDLKGFGVEEETGSGSGLTGEDLLDIVGREVEEMSRREGLGDDSHRLDVPTGRPGTDLSNDLGGIRDRLDANGSIIDFVEGTRTPGLNGGLGGLNGGVGTLNPDLMGGLNGVRPGSVLKANDIISMQDEPRISLQSMGIDPGTLNIGKTSLTPQEVPQQVGVDMPAAGTTTSKVGSIDRFGEGTSGTGSVSQRSLGTQDGTRTVSRMISAGRGDQLGGSTTVQTLGQRGTSQSQEVVAEFVRVTNDRLEIDLLKHGQLEELSHRGNSTSAQPGSNSVRDTLLALYYQVRDSMRQDYVQRKLTEFKDNIDMSRYTDTLYHCEFTVRPYDNLKQYVDALLASHSLTTEYDLGAAAQATLVSVQDRDNLMNDPKSNDFAVYADQAKGWTTTNTYLKNPYYTMAYWANWLFIGGGALDGGLFKKKPIANPVSLAVRFVDHGLRQSNQPAGGKLWRSIDGPATHKITGVSMTNYGGGHYGVRAYKTIWSGQEPVLDCYGCEIDPTDRNRRTGIFHNDSCFIYGSDRTAYQHQSYPSFAPHTVSEYCQSVKPQMYHSVITNSQGHSVEQRFNEGKPWMGLQKQVYQTIENDIKLFNQMQAKVSQMYDNLNPASMTTRSAQTVTSFAGDASVSTIRIEGHGEMDFYPYQLMAMFGCMPAKGSDYSTYQIADGMIVPTAYAFEDFVNMEWNSLHSSGFFFSRANPNYKNSLVQRLHTPFVAKDYLQGRIRYYEYYLYRPDLYHVDNMTTYEATQPYSIYVTKYGAGTETVTNSRPQ